MWAIPGLAEEEWGMDNSLLFTLKYRDSHNGSHSPLDFFRKSRFADGCPIFDYPSFRLSWAHSGVRLLLLSSPADIPLSSDD